MKSEPMLAPKEKSPLPQKFSSSEDNNDNNNDNNERISRALSMWNMLSCAEQVQIQE